MALKEKVQIFAIRKAFGYLEKNPEENLLRLVQWLQYSLGDPDGPHQSIFISMQSRLLSYTH